MCWPEALERTWPKRAPNRCLFSSPFIPEEASSSLRVSLCWVYEDVWRCMKMYEDVWRCMKMYEDVWRCMKMYEDVWRCMKMYEDVWRCMKYSFGWGGGLHGYGIMTQNNGQMQFRRCRSEASGVGPRIGPSEPSCSGICRGPGSGVALRSRLKWSIHRFHSIPLSLGSLYFRCLMQWGPKSTLETLRLCCLKFLGVWTILNILPNSETKQNINPFAILFGMRVIFSLGPCCLLYFAVFGQLGKFPVAEYYVHKMNSKRPSEPKCVDVEFLAIRVPRFKKPTVQNLGPNSAVQPVRFLIGACPKEHIEDHLPRWGLLRRQQLDSEPWRDGIHQLQ